MDETKRIKAVAELSGFSERDIDSICQSLRLNSKNVTFMTKAEYDQCLRELVPGSSLSKDAKSILSHEFSKIFFALDPNEENRVWHRHLICGLCLLCSGSKSSKLAYTYRFFFPEKGNSKEEERSGLSFHELADFLWAFFSVLCALVLPSDVSGARVTEVAEGVSREVAELVFDTISPSNKRISFEEFGNWYNTGGFEITPWLELLDHGKWSYPVTDTIKKYFLQDGVELMADEDEDENVEEERDEEEEQEQDIEEDLADQNAQDSADQDDEETDELPNHSVSINKPNQEEEEDQSVQDESAAFEFVLDPEGERPLVLNILPIDIAILQSMARSTGLSSLSVEDLGSALLEAASDEGVLTKHEFDRTLRQLVPASRLDKRERDRYSTLLATIFLVFDRDCRMEVDVLEFISGFMLFCDGSKSVKLAYAFEMLDEPNHGWLSRRGVWQYFRAILSMLAALCSSLLDIPTDELQSMIDDGAVWTTAKVFSSTLLGNSSRLTFDELASWYTGGGYRVCPWLELLDLKKWQIIPSKTSNPFSTKGSMELEEQQEIQGDDMLPEEEGETEEGEASGAVVFTFPLDTKDNSLEITADDIDFIEQVSMSSGFAVRTPEQILNYFVTMEVGETVTKIQFDKAVRLMIPEHFLSEDDKALLSFALSNVFFSYDPCQTNEVPLRDLMCGLSLLCAGTKSSKLAFTFQLYATKQDAVGEPLLNRWQAASYLRAFLTCLCSCTAQMLEMPVTEKMAKVDGAVNWASSKLFDSNSDPISFEDFGNWYNTGGFQFIPWLELLDLTKWVPGVASVTADINAARQGEEAETESPMRFQFVIKDGPNEAVELVLSERDVDTVQEFSEKTGLIKIEPKHAGNLFLQYSEDGLLEKKNFDRCVRQLIPGQSLTAEEKQKYSGLLSAIFFAYDRDGSSQVDVLEFMSGFTLLCSGNKSSKLAYAFDLLDEDEDGRLSRRGLWRFLRSFLSILMSLSEQKSSLVANHMITLTDEGAVWIAAKIFQETKLEEKNKIGFEELASWYTDGGYKISPWLELLDLKKWVFPAEQ